MEQVLPEEVLGVVVLVLVVVEWGVWEVTCQAPGLAVTVFAPRAEQQFLTKEGYHAARFNVPNAEVQCFGSK